MTNDYDNNEKYLQAISLGLTGSIKNKKKAVELFEELGNYRNSTELITKVKQSRGKVARKRFFKIALAIVIVIALAGGTFWTKEYGIDLYTYHKAESLMEEGEYEQAIEIFETIPSVKDSKQQIDKAYVKMAIAESKKDPSHAEEILQYVSEKTDDYYDALKIIAEAYFKEEKDDKALAIYDKLKKAGYSVSESDYAKVMRGTILHADAGNQIEFGSYKGVDPLTWIVFSNEDNELMMVCKSVVKFSYYNDKDSKSKTDDSKKEKFVAFEKSSLCKWLNSDFYDNAFTAEEKKCINNDSVWNKKVSLVDWELAENYGAVYQEELFIPEYITKEYHDFAKSKGKIAAKKTEDGYRFEYFVIDSSGDKNPQYMDSNSSFSSEIYKDKQYAVVPVIWVDAKKIAEETVQ